MDFKDLLTKTVPDIRMINDKVSPIQPTIFGRYINFKLVTEIYYDIEIISYYEYNYGEGCDVSFYIIGKNIELKFTSTYHPKSVDIDFIKTVFPNQYPYDYCSKEYYLECVENRITPTEFCWYNYDKLEQDVMRITEQLISIWEIVLNEK
jgi:hypothetical protein